jgi:hypothetical protein
MVYAYLVDAHTQKPRRDDGRERANEFMRLIAVMKRNHRQVVLWVVMTCLLLGFLPGVFYNDTYGHRTTFWVKGVPEGETIEIARWSIGS